MLRRLRGSDKLAAVAALSYAMQRYLADALSGGVVGLVDSVLGTSAVRVVDTLGDSAFVGVFISTAGGFGALLNDLSLLTQVSLYTVGLYVAFPELIDIERTELVEADSVRIAVALWSGVFGLLISLSPSLWTVFVPLVLVPPATFAIVFRQYGPEENRRNGYVLAALELTQEDPESIRDGYDPDSLTSVLLSIYAGGLILTFISLLLGGLVIVFVSVYPLFEITLIGIWLVSLVDRYTRTNWFDSPRERMERDFFEIIDHAVAHKFTSVGAIAIFVSAIGASAIPVILVFAVFVAGGLELLTTLLSVRGVGGVPILVGGLAYGIYGLIYWRRVAQRFPAMLQPRSRQTASTNVCRLPGEMLVPSSTVVLVGVLALVQALVIHYTGTDTAPIWVVFLIGVVLLAWLVVAVRRYGAFLWQVDEPQPPTSDVWAVPKAWTTQVVGLVTGVWLVWGYDAAKTGGFDALGAALLAEAPGLLMVLLFVPAVVGLFSVDRLTTPLPERLLDIDSEIFVVAGILVYLLLVVGATSLM